MTQSDASSTAADVLAASSSRQGPLARAWGLLWVRGLGRLLALVLVAPIKLYQVAVSPALPASCKYHPSCSRYAERALLAHGPFKGLALGTWRLARCNPWSKGGVDPVPDRGRWLPDVLPDGKPRTTPARPADPTSHPLGA